MIFLWFSYDFPVLGLGYGVCRSVFNDHLNEGEAQTLHTCILFERSLVNSNVHFPKSQTVFMFLIFRVHGNADDSLKPLFLTLVPTNYINSIKEISNHIFEKNDLMDIRNFEIESYEKDMCRKILDVDLIQKTCEILNMKSISSGNLGIFQFT